MRSTASITTIKGNGECTVFLEGATGALWYVSVSDGACRLLVSQGVADVALGKKHGLVLMKDGTVSAFRTIPGDELAQWESHGQFGIGEASLETDDVVPTGLRNIASVACGDHFSLALSHDHVLYSCGQNHMGQLGGVHGNRSVSRFERVAFGVTAITAARDLAIAHWMDNTVSYAGRAEMHACGTRQTNIWTEMNVPHDARIVVEAGRSVAVTSSGEVWHTGTLAPRSTPANYHFTQRQEWDLVPNLRLSTIELGRNGQAIALSPKGEVLAAAGPSSLKLGCWQSGVEHLDTNREHGIQVAITPHASFVRHNDLEWVAAYEKNPHAALCVRPDGDDFESMYSYQPMAHPSTWQQCSSLRDLGLSDQDAIAAALAVG